MGVQVCRLPALKPLKPSKRSKRSKRLKPSKPLKTVKPFKRWLGMLHPASALAANRHPRATHQWLSRLPALLQPTGIPGPHINGFLWAQVCRLPALKPLKPSKRSKRLKPSKPLKTVKPFKRWLGMLHPAANSHPCSQQPPRATHQSLLMATLASNRHPKATHQWLLMATLAANRHPRATHQNPPKPPNA